MATESKRRQQLREAAQLLFSRVMAGRVLTFDIAAAEEFSRIAAHRRKMGRPISHPDAQNRCNRETRRRDIGNPKCA